MVRKTKEEAERTFHALLDAAATLFIHQGVAKTTLNDIAHKAEMSRGAIYWHFKNKDAVIQALWERNADKLYESLNKVVSQVTPPHPGASFRLALNEMLQSLIREPEIAQVMRIIIHNVELTDEQTVLQQFLMEKKEDIYQLMERAVLALKNYDALKVDLPHDLLAQSIMCYVHGLLHCHLSPEQRKINLLTDGEVLLNTFLDAYLSEETPKE